MMLFVAFALGFIISSITSDNCPNGGEIYAVGISQDGKDDVVATHNGCRLRIANGSVPEQPRGINLKKMIYDDILGQKGRAVSDTCIMSHIVAIDNRWNWVGQNLYIERSSKQTANQNWTGAIEYWFNEYKDYEFPKGSKNGNQVGHYTQTVWANSENVGCDFISFYDPAYPQYPYSKLYTCNYGPGGNWINQAPYETGSSGCEELC